MLPVAVADVRASSSGQITAPLAVLNPTVGQLMERFYAIVYKPNGYLVARPRWLGRKQRSPA